MKNLSVLFAVVLVGLTTNVLADNASVDYQDGYKAALATCNQGEYWFCTIHCLNDYGNKKDKEIFSIHGYERGATLGRLYNYINNFGIGLHQDHPGESFSDVSDCNVKFDAGKAVCTKL